MDPIQDYGPGSPVRLALERLAHKWTVLIVWALRPGPLRFTELRSAAAGITSQVLTRSLRDLERDGIVLRRYFPEVPPRVEYELTELGHSMCTPVTAVRTWAERYGPQIQEARCRAEDAETDLTTTAPSKVLAATRLPRMTDSGNVPLGQHDRTAAG